MTQNSGSSPIWEGFGEFLRSPFVKTQRNHENSMKFPTRTQFFPSPKLNENTKTQFLDIFLANQSQKTLKKKSLVYYITTKSFFGFPHLHGYFS